MEDALLVLLGIAATLIVGLLGLLGVLLRRNGKNSHNPNFETLAMAVKNNGDDLGDIKATLEGIAKSLTVIETTIKFCPTVQASIERGG